MTGATERRADAGGPIPLTADGRRRGAFVVVVGPDGVGKTTIARAILERYDGPTAYFHFLPLARRPLASAPPGRSDGPPPRTSLTGSRVIGWVRLARNVARSWIGHLARVRPAVRRGSLVVGDRWLYGYVVQPHALAYYGPRQLVHAAMRMLPRPDLIVNLSAPPELINARKQELTFAQIEAELRRWADLPTDRIRTFDATAAPDVIATQVLRALQEQDSTSMGRRMRP